MSFKNPIKHIVGLFTRDYKLNRIYRHEIAARSPINISRLPVGVTIRPITSKEQVQESSNERMRDHSWYAGEHAIGYGIWEADDLVCMTWFWRRAHPQLPGRFSSLRTDEAIMVDLLTAPACRGKGYAAVIADYAANDLRDKGYSCLWTWVWHSNSPSIRVFEKVGWEYSYFLLELKFRGMRDYVRFRLPPVI